MVIDVHSHFLPDTVISYIRKHGDKVNSEVITKDGREFIWDKQGGIFPIYPEYYDYGKKAADLDRYGIDMSVLSVVPNAYYYWAAPENAYEIARICNDWVCDFSASHSKRFSGMATIPMQDPVLGLKELRRCCETLGLKALATAPMIQDVHLDAEKFFPIYEYCEAQNILLFLHPCFSAERKELKEYYNMNLVGNVYQTALGINHLILGGVFEKFPGLKVLASHGGGFFPYQAGRICHGAAVREEPNVNISQSPEAYYGNVYFDTITHWNAALQFLVDQFGSDHVMLGTDYPFDMGDYQAVQHVHDLKLTGMERQNICSENAARIFRLSLSREDER